jgi:hypothetical protein
MVLTRTWRNAVNKVTGIPVSTSLKAAAAAILFAAAGSLAAQAPAPAAPAAAAAKPPTAGTKSPAPRQNDKPLWNTLSKPQQVALEPLAGEWDKMEGLRKQKWLEIANRFSSMKPDEQARVHERMRDWIKMTPEQRRVVRENYTRTKKIDPGEKSQQWEQYQQLPAEQKKQLAAEAASARAKKQVANLPTQAQSSVKTVAPIKRAPAPACPAGTIANTAASTPPCVPVAVPAPVPAAAPAAAPVTPPQAIPAATVPNAK